MSTMLATYFLCSEGTTVLRRIFHVSPSAGMRPVPMTNSRISESSPLLKLVACVRSISFATSLSDTTTNFFGPIASTNISPYAWNSVYRGTNTGWPAISRMSPIATGIFPRSSLRHRRATRASWYDKPRSVFSQSERREKEDREVLTGQRDARERGRRVVMRGRLAWRHAAR